MKNKRPSVCIIGAGNVATHITHALDNVADIVQIYSRSSQNALCLASSIGKPHIATDSLEDITTEASFYIVCVKDDGIAQVAAHTPNTGIWAHTSGSIPMSVFKGNKSRYGVFYPLQTFSKDVTLDIKKVPFFIEGNDLKTSNLLISLAELISDIVEPADSERRKTLHLAAVFACNFVNFMWIQADEILNENGLDIGYLKPLLFETLNKLNSISPTEAQTGPARRGDQHIIDNHLSQLRGDRREIYTLISDLIIKKYNRQLL